LEVRVRGRMLAHVPLGDSGMRPRVARGAHTSNDTELEKLKNIYELEKLKNQYEECIVCYVLCISLLCITNCKRFLSFSGMLKKRSGMLKKLGDAPQGRPRRRAARAAGTSTAR
jgi:hypothetical protein